MMKKLNYVILGILVLGVLILNFNLIENKPGNSDFKILENSRDISNIPKVSNEIIQDNPVVKNSEKKTSSEKTSKEDSKEVHKKIIFIDPSRESSGDGSIDNPLRSWGEISEWEEGFQYLQKRGTTDYLEHQLDVEGKNLFLGSYGEGDAPIIKSNSGKY
jgi:hypothetical protein